MRTFEAEYMEAQQALRQVSGTVAVLAKQLRSAADMICDLRSMLEDLSYSLPGGARKEVIIMQRRCEDWQRNNERISTEAPE